MYRTIEEWEETKKWKDGISSVPFRLLMESVSDIQELAQQRDELQRMLDTERAAWSAKRMELLRINDSELSRRKASESQRDDLQSALNAERASLFAESQKRQDVERQLAEAISSRQAAQRELVQVVEETQRRAEVLIKDAFRRGVDSERDACSKLCEQMSDDIASPLYSAAANDCAIAIRARSDKA